MDTRAAQEYVQVWRVYGEDWRLRRSERQKTIFFWFTLSHTLLPILGRLLYVSYLLQDLAQCIRAQRKNQAMHEAYTVEIIVCCTFCDSNC